MKRGPAILISCAALALGSGCGSSPRSSTSSSGATSSRPSTTAGGFKVSTTPKFASPPAGAQVQSGTVHIAYRNITIAPDTVKVKVGTTVVWTNQDPVEHNVTSRGGPQRFVSGNFGEGKSFQVTLVKPGVIHYLCTIHPTSMNGTIAVVK